MVTESFPIAAMRSRQAVLRLDSMLRRAGAGTEIVSTPRQVAIGCGLSLRFDMKDLPLVKQYLRGQEQVLIGLYRVENAGGRVHVTPLA